MEGLPPSRGGSIVLVTTAGKERPNVKTMGFHIAAQHDPPLIGCIVGPWDYSYRSLRENLRMRHRHSHRRSRTQGRG